MYLYKKMNSTFFKDLANVIDKTTDKSSKTIL